jgi:hypothetical protein
MVELRHDFLLVELSLINFERQNCLRYLGKKLLMSEESGIFKGDSLYPWPGMIQSKLSFLWGAAVAQRQSDEKINKT